MPLGDALDFVAQVLATPEPVLPDLTTHAGRVEYARNDATIRQERKAGRKIAAIKELRFKSLCGLKEAKDAVEEAYPDSWVQSYMPYNPSHY